jgi:hypothetical protein
MNMNMMTTTLKLNLIHPMIILCPRNRNIIIPFAPSSSSVTITTLTHHQQHTSSSITGHTARTHSHSHPFPEPHDDDDDQVEVLRVPPHWLLPTNASQVPFSFILFQFYKHLRLFLAKIITDKLAYGGGTYIFIKLYYLIADKLLD